MSNLNMEFGFNVPKSVIYEALTHPLYAYIHSARSCSSLGLRLRSNPKKEANLSSSREKLEESS